MLLVENYLQYRNNFIKLMQNDNFDASKANPAIQKCVDCYVISSFLLCLLIIVLLDKSKADENKLYFK